MAAEPELVLHEVSRAGLVFTATGHPVHGTTGKPTAIIGPARSGSLRRFRVCKLASFADRSGVEELRVGVVENSTYAGLRAGQSWHSRRGATNNCAFFLCCNAARSGLRTGGTMGPSQTRTVREGGVITVQRVGTAVRFWLSEQCNEAPLSDSNPEGYLELEMQLPPGLADPDLQFAVQFHNHADAVMVEPELLLHDPRPNRSLPGFHSVFGKASAKGPLNYDEIVVYEPAAIYPWLKVTYEFVKL